jgi:hypothetical protein
MEAAAVAAQLVNQLLLRWAGLRRWRGVWLSHGGEECLEKL